MHELYEQREDYLKHALQFSAAEDELVEEFEEWLPDNIIDAHSHSNLPEHVSFIADEAYHHMLSTFPSYSIEESEASQKLLHPTKNIRNLRFAKTFRGIAHKAANDYLLNNSPEHDRVALFGLPEDPAYTIDMLQDPRVSALKMYYSYLNPPAKTIYEIFKPEILAAASDNDIPIVLHTPRMIVDSADDVLAMTRDFPDLRVAIAHLGSSKFDVPGLQESYDELAEQTTVMLDTALNPSPDVVRRALTTFGPDRIMFGSDEPLNFIRSVPFIHPIRGQRIATVFPYHWQDPEEHAEYKHLADGAVHSHWLALTALKTVISEYNDPKEQNDIKTRIFHDNAEHFYGF